jgi:hypothetical protein
MRMSRIIVALVVCALSSQMAWSQEESLAGSNGVLGYLDPSTGAFRPVSQMADFDSESAAEASTLTGTFVVNFTITVKSAIPATAPITCSVSADLIEASLSGVNIIVETATVVGTRTGSTAKCTVTIPYSWTVLNLTTAKVSLTYSLSGGKATATAGLVSRSNSGGIASIPVPANGATTTQTVNAVL